MRGYIIHSLNEVPREVNRKSVRSVILHSEQIVHKLLVCFSLLFQAVMLFNVVLPVPHQPFSQLMIWHQPLRLMHKFLVRIKAKYVSFTGKCHLKLSIEVAWRYAVFFRTWNTINSMRKKTKKKIKPCTLISEYFKKVCALPAEGAISGSRLTCGCPIDLYTLF